MHTLVYCKSNQQNRLSKKINQNQWTLGFVGSICFHNFHQVLWHWEHARDERVWTRDLQKVQRCKSHFQNINMVRAQHYTIYIHTSKCGIFLLFLWSLYISNSVWNHACNTRAMSHTEILRCWQEHYTLYLPILFAHRNDINLVQLCKGNSLYVCAVYIWPFTSVI